MADWEWELQPTYEGLVRAIEIMSCGMVVEDADGIIHYANRASSSRRAIAPENSTENPSR